MSQNLKCVFLLTLLLGALGCGSSGGSSSDGSKAPKTPSTALNESRPLESAVSIVDSKMILHVQFTASQSDQTQRVSIEHSKEVRSICLPMNQTLNLSISGSKVIVSADDRILSRIAYSATDDSKVIVQPKHQADCVAATN